MKSLRFKYPNPPEEAKNLKHIMQKYGIPMQNDEKEKVLTFDLPDEISEEAILALGAIIGQSLTSSQYCGLIERKWGINLGL